MFAPWHVHRSCDLMNLTRFSKADSTDCAKAVYSEVTNWMLHQPEKVKLMKNRAAPLRSSLLSHSRHQQRLIHFHSETLHILNACLPLKTKLSFVMWRRRDRWLARICRSCQRALILRSGLCSTLADGQTETNCAEGKVAMKKKGEIRKNNNKRRRQWRHSPAAML